MTDSREDPPVVRRTPFPSSVTRPLAPPLFLSAVYAATDTDQMDRIYEGEEPGFTYAREGSPNSEQLASKIARLEGAEACLITGSGMSAVAALLIGLLKAGDHVVAGNQLYGRTHRLVRQELPRFGIDADLVDASDPAAVRSAIRENTRMILVEAVSNPLLRVADVEALAQMARSTGVLFAVDNTFPTPLALRPLELGADIVLHSITKMLAGHSDVTLGALCCSREIAEPIRETIITFGLVGSPFDCWLAERGMNTLEVRVAGANSTAAALADFLAGHDAVNRFMRALPDIPFAPTLGDVATIISHPGVTSHRGLTPEEREQIGIREGMVRVSVGLESPDLLERELQQALQAAM